MEKRLRMFTTLSFMLAALFLLAVVPGASADSIQDQIQALKAEVAKLEGQQMELKKQATEAAAALPTFTYRTGFLGITAADKSWQISFSHEWHMHMYNFVDGNDKRGHTTGDLFTRRNRPFIYYCWDDCLYEIGFGIDMDDGDLTTSQHTRFIFHLENINPYLPTIEVADRGLEQPSPVQRSSSSSARVELTRDMLNDGAYDTLSHAGIGAGWLGVPLGQGEVTLWFENRMGAGFSQNTNSDTDRKQFQLKASMRPFSKTKNEWLRGLNFGIGWLSTSLDKRATASRRLALRTDDRIGRIRTMDANNIGAGTHNAVFPGLEWRVGPYLFRTEMAHSRYANDGTAAFGGKTVKGFVWSLQNELFVWSPKGFLTGSSRTPNSVLVGWSFARADMDCGTGNDCTPGDSTSSKGHLTKRELNLWYFLRPGLNVGVWWNWWDTPNMPTTLQEGVGCSNGTTRVGKNCDWHSVNLGLRANF